MLSASSMGAGGSCCPAVSALPSLRLSAWVAAGSWAWKMVQGATGGRCGRSAAVWVLPIHPLASRPAGAWVLMPPVVAALPSLGCRHGGNCVIQACFCRNGAQAPICKTWGVGACPHLWKLLRVCVRVYVCALMLLAWSKHKRTTHLENFFLVLFLCLHGHAWLMLLF